jgi:hypothetical protein
MAKLLCYALAHGKGNRARQRTFAVRWRPAKLTCARQRLRTHGKAVTHGKELIIAHACTLPAAHYSLLSTLSGSPLLLAHARPLPPLATPPPPPSNPPPPPSQLMPSSSPPPSSSTCPRVSQPRPAATALPRSRASPPPAPPRQPRPSPAAPAPPQPRPRQPRKLLPRQPAATCECVASV